MKTKIYTTVNGLMTIMLSLILAIGFFQSCDDDDAGVPTETGLTLSLEYAQVGINSEVELVPKFTGTTLPQKDYTWTVSDTNILKIKNVESSYVATILAVGEGEATATLASSDGKLEASCRINSSVIKETEVTLPASATAYTQVETTITPSFNNVMLPIRSYTWSTSPAGILEIKSVDETSQEVTVQGLMEGTATLTITSSDGVVVGSMQVDVVDENDGIVKILAIGNSFSEDALESYLWGLADAAGKQIVIGNMYIGGADLATHATNAADDSGSYSYRKITEDGMETTTANVSISTAIADENWDYISFQQGSYDSGIYSTFVDPLPALYNSVNDLVTNEYTKYVLHRTWAYAQNSTHSGFANYNNDQMTMYDAIIDAYDQAKALIPTYDIIPTGTGIQNGRTSYLEDNFCRDGYHLNEIGKYVASCVWFEKLFGESVVGNTYVPSGFLAFNAELAQHAADEAVNNPNQITELVDYQDAGGTGILTAPLYVDFSLVSNSPGWNGMTNYLAGSSIPNMLYTDNTFSGVKAEITRRFNGQNTNGATGTTTAMNMPDDVSKYNFFGNSFGPWSGIVVDTSEVVLSGFQSSDTYDLCFFSSRATAENRETEFVVTGSTSQTTYVNAGSNATEIGCVTGIAPDANGEISIKVTAGPNNANGNGFFYFNAMSISPH